MRWSWSSLDRVAPASLPADLRSPSGGSVARCLSRCKDEPKHDRRLQAGGTVLAGALLWFAAPALAAPTLAEIRSAWRPSDAVLLDRHGDPLATLRVDFKVRRGAWIALDQVSPALVVSIVEAEDRRFREHAGVDWQALVAGFGSQIGVGPRRGASTITMQLAALLDPALAPRAGSRTLAQKWRQIRAARDIEKSWSKNQILEAYLNLVSFRGELQGIDGTSRALLGKSPGGLDASDSLLLAALLPSPNAKPARIAARACALAVRHAARSDCEALKRVVIAALDRPAQDDAAAVLPPALLDALARSPRRRVTSTLDARLQAFAEAALRAQLASLRSEEVRDGALVVLDNASGDVLAYVPNAGRAASARFVDGVRAPRQAGSTLKPLLYALAIDRRLLTAASVLDDSPVSLATPAGMYIPQNYDPDFKGPVSLRTALGSSLNVPAVRTLLLTGVDAFHAWLQALGYSTLTEAADYYGYALALGAPEVTLLDQANAYRALANGGVWSPLRFQPVAAALAGRRVMSAATAFIVADVLADPAARSVTFGLDNPLATRGWAAVKTGTSKDMRDNWAIGFSARYTVAVWVGNFSGQSMRNISGVTGAAPVWREIIDWLSRDSPGTAPVAPALVAVPVSFTGDIEPPRREWFLPGTESGEMALVSTRASVTPRIAYPGNGAIIALDPDIPAGHQAVFFDARSGAQDLHWVLDGNLGGFVKWTPRSGVHALALVAGDGRVFDRVEFSVRGALRPGSDAAGRAPRRTPPGAAATHPPPRW